MPSQIKIFLWGATGYIGGTVLTRLLDHPSAFLFQITILVRSREKAAKLEALGITTVVGSNADLDVLTTIAEASDVVFSIANSNDLDAMKAVLVGLKKRHESTGVPPAVIHTSGAGILDDKALGMFASEKIYSDFDAEAIEALPPTNIHRGVDMALVEADSQGYVKTFIVLPPIVYGHASGRLVDLGIQNPFSLGIPGLLKVAMARGAAGALGLGKNIWGTVHIDELADLFVILFDSISNDCKTAHGREGYYFAENTECALSNLYKAVAEALVSSGLSPFPKVTTFTPEEITVTPLLTFFGLNARCRGDRSRALGWKPIKNSEDMLASVKPELEMLLKSWAVAPASVLPRNALKHKRTLVVMYILYFFSALLVAAILLWIISVNDLYRFSIAQFSTQFT